MKISSILRSAIPSVEVLGPRRDTPSFQTRLTPLE